MWVNLFVWFFFVLEIVGLSSCSFFNFGRIDSVGINILNLVIEILFFWRFSWDKFGRFLKVEIRDFNLWLVKRLCESISFFKCGIEESDFEKVEKFLFVIMFDCKCIFWIEIILGRNFFNIWRVCLLIWLCFIINDVIEEVFSRKYIRVFIL